MAAGVSSPGAYMFVWAFQFFGLTRRTRKTNRYYSPTWTDMKQDSSPCRLVFLFLAGTGLGELTGSNDGEMSVDGGDAGVPFRNIPGRIGVQKITVHGWKSVFD